MTKSRNLRCISAINTVFEQYNIYYDLIKLNVPGYSVARYELTIPKQWETVEPFYNDENTVLEWIKQTHEQTLPNIDDIRVKFDEIHKPYQTDNSYLLIHSAKGCDTEILFKIFVKYYKKEIPFPENMHSLEQRIYKLETQNYNLRQNFLKYKTETSKYIHQLDIENHDLYFKELTNGVKRKKIINQYTKMVESYHKIAREYFIELDIEKEDCPVCYESIPNNNLFITPCKHTMCSMCASKCSNSCPLCRQELGIINNH
jgi:hypothetical protein